MTQQRLEHIQPTDGASTLNSITWEHVSQAVNAPSKPTEQTGQKTEQAAKTNETPKTDQTPKPGEAAKAEQKHKSEPMPKSEEKPRAEHTPQKPGADTEVHNQIVPGPEGKSPAKRDFSNKNDAPKPKVLKEPEFLELPPISNGGSVSAASSGSNESGAFPSTDRQSPQSTDSITGDNNRTSVRAVEGQRASMPEPWTWNEVVGATTAFPLGAAEVLRERREYKREHQQFLEMNDQYTDIYSSGSFGERELSQVQIREMARQFDNACNGGLTGIGTNADAVINILSKIPHNQMKDFDQAYRDRTGGKLGVQDELLDELSGDHLDIARSHFTGESARLDDSLNTRKFDYLNREMSGNREREMANKAPECLKIVYEELAKIKGKHSDSEAQSERTLWNTMPADQRRRLAAELKYDFSPSMLSERRDDRNGVPRSQQYVDLEDAVVRKRVAALGRARAEQQEYLMNLPESVRVEMDKFENRPKKTLDEMSTEFNTKNLRETDDYHVRINKAL